MKVIFDASITDAEIEKCIKLAEKGELEIILQPVMIGKKIQISKENLLTIFNKFTDKYDRVRLLPQLHKFINID